jgi:hypothetical protein
MLVMTIVLFTLLLGLTGMKHHDVGQLSRTSCWQKSLKLALRETFTNKNSRL